jgi:hypothetical protein
MNKPSDNNVKNKDGLTAALMTTNIMESLWEHFQTGERASPAFFFDKVKSLCEGLRDTSLIEWHREMITVLYKSFQRLESIYPHLSGISSELSRRHQNIVSSMVGTSSLAADGRNRDSSLLAAIEDTEVSTGYPKERVTINAQSSQFINHLLRLIDFIIADSLHQCQRSSLKTIARVVTSYAQRRKGSVSQFTLGYLPVAPFLVELRISPRLHIEYVPV